MPQHIAHYVHPDAKVAVLVKLETADEATLRQPEFLAFAAEMALHIAYADPLCLSVHELDLSAWNREVQAHKRELIMVTVVERERRLAQLRQQFEQRNVLLLQRYVRDESRTVEQLLDAISARLGGVVRILQFVRYDARGP